MINPKAITNFHRTTAELQEFLLFCVLVQGKRSDIQTKKLHWFLDYLAHITGCDMPFKMMDIAMNYEDDETGETLLDEAMRKFGLGQYGRLFQAIEDMIRLPDLRTVTVKELVKCHAIGPKSARFFVVHSRPNAWHAVLDTHVLKWLRLQGVECPERTPQGKLYAKIEKIFLTFVRKSGLSVAEFDLNIWKSFAS